MKYDSMILIPVTDQNGELERYQVQKVVLCNDCRYYVSRCCLKYGKQEHPSRYSDDFCSRGEELSND